MVRKNKGLVYVFTGEGKGKTSAAIGTAVRAIGAGMRVSWVGFYKQESWGLSELEPLRELGVEVYLLGRGFRIRNQKPETRNQDANKVRTAPVGSEGQVVVDVASEEEHKKAAEAGMEKVRKLISQKPKAKNQKLDVLVLDEANNAVADNLIDLIDLIDLISNRKEIHIVLTGRDAASEIIELADLVTEMGKVKHPYDAGKLAVKGLDF